MFFLPIYCSHEMLQFTRTFIMISNDSMPMNDCVVWRLKCEMMLILRYLVFERIFRGGATETVFCSHKLLNGWIRVNGWFRSMVLFWPSDTCKSWSKKSKTRLKCASSSFGDSKNGVAMCKVGPKSRKYAWNVDPPSIKIDSFLHKKSAQKKRHKVVFATPDRRIIGQIINLETERLWGLPPWIGKVGKPPWDASCSFI